MCSLFQIFAIISVFENFGSAEITIITRTATSIEWAIKDSLQSGKRHSVEVLLDTGKGTSRVIDEPLPAKAKTYKAINLRPNQIYQLRVYVAGDQGKLSRPTYTNQRCYSCSGVRTVAQCTKIVECSTNQRQCYTRVRHIASGSRFSISKGCKINTDVCIPNIERINLVRNMNLKTGDLTDKQVLETMPGLKHFGNLEKLFTKSPAILTRVKKKFEEDQEKKLSDALKIKCTQREDPNDFCRCCCNEEGCNHGFLDCGITPPPESREDEPLPPDIATTPPPITTPAPTKPTPVCRDFNGGCDHICIPLNKTTVRCKCNNNYKLQDDGKTCKTHLLHAVADAGPDINITLPQNSVTISAKMTRGSPKRYKWWSPIAIGEHAGLTTSDQRNRDLHVTNLKVGEYKFILMVIGMDRKRTSDVMTLRVNPNPSYLLNGTQGTGTREELNPRPGIVALNRFGSVGARKEWKHYVKEMGFTTKPPKSTFPPLLFRRATTPRLSIIRRPGQRRVRSTTSATTTTTSTPTTSKSRPGVRRPPSRGRRPTRGRGSRGRGSRGRRTTG